MADLGILPVLFYELQPRDSLKRDVNLGPFTHKVDDGLPLRKVRRSDAACCALRSLTRGVLVCASPQAAFSCMDSILEHMREKVGPSFLPRLRGGLQDENPDVQVLRS